MTRIRFDLEAEAAANSVVFIDPDEVRWVEGFPHGKFSLIYLKDAASARNAMTFQVIGSLTEVLEKLEAPQLSFMGQPVKHCGCSACEHFFRENHVTWRSR